MFWVSSDLSKATACPKEGHKGLSSSVEVGQIVLMEVSPFSFLDEILRNLFLSTATNRSEKAHFLVQRQLHQTFEELAISKKHRVRRYFTFLRLLFTKQTQHVVCTKHAFKTKYSCGRHNFAFFEDF